ncbi:MAG: Bug family tripartite tricarboxylate transporter substrate binding protein [Burkholderiales bacterium]
MIYRNFVAAVSIIGWLITSQAVAQSFPAKPIRIIVPTSPGGLNDLLSRGLAQQVSESIGQPVVVENRPGGGSMIGMQFLSRSTPDGYTLGVTTKEPLVYNLFLYSKLPYDPDNDFSYVTHLVRTLGIIVANAAAPGATFPEMIAYAKANPGKLNWATWGPGSTPAIYLEWIRNKNAVDIAAIPYKGAGPSVPAILSGEVHLTYTGIGLVIPHVQSGKLRALAITGANRASVFPNVPHLSQFNSDPDFASGFSLYGPAKIPMPIQERLATEFRKALGTSQLAQIMAGTMEPVGSTPAEFVTHIRAERDNARMVFKALGIKPTAVPD